MSDIPALSVEHLQVRYGDLVGVADVSLQVPQGQVVALLGSNGAGKTTTLNAIAGLVRPSGGSIKWHGEEIGALPAYAIVPKGLALSPEGWRLFVNQTVEQFCSIASSRSFRASPSGGASRPARCPAASVRCWRSAVR